MLDTQVALVEAGVHLVFSEFLALFRIKVVAVHAEEVDTVGLETPLFSDIRSRTPS